MRHGVDEHRRVRPGHDARAEDVGVRVAAGDRLAQDRLDLGLVRGVGEAVVAARGHLLGEQAVGVLGEAVRRDRRGVDEALRTRRDGGLEHVARALDVDVARVRRCLHDDEREVHDDVGAVDQPLDRRPVEHVAAAVLGALPAVLGGVERPPGHADDAPDLARGCFLERRDERLADLAGRAGHRDGQAAGGPPGRGHQPAVSPPLRARSRSRAVLRKRRILRTLTR